LYVIINTVYKLIKSMLREPSTAQPEPPWIEEDIVRQKPSVVSI